MKLPPREWIQTMRAAFKDPEPIIETYLNTFKPDPAPYRRTHDRAMRYREATDVAAFLITGPEGHLVLDAGYPTTATLIMASIAKLGFDIKDVKVLLNSEPRPDHAGGLTALQQASGAELWASEASAPVIASG